MTGLTLPPLPYIVPYFPAPISADWMRGYAALAVSQAIALQAERHREELLAYELTVSNLREQNESEQCWCDAQGIGKPGISCGDCPTRDYRQPERKPLPEDDGGKP